MPKKIPLRERFLSRVRTDPSGCSIWMGSDLGGGYGGFSIGSRTVYAHRIAWELERGPLPSGRRVILDHLCRNRRCVNVEHLELVTFRENVIRGIGPTASNAAKTHCLNGHLLGGENVYETDPHRRCKICARDRARRHWLKRRGAGNGADSAVSTSAITLEPADHSR